jgi:uncharacterized membrane protein YadS
MWLAPQKAQVPGELGENRGTDWSLCLSARVIDLILSVGLMLMGGGGGSPVALAVGTTVKLARALWIVPLAIATAMMTKSKAKVSWPWFILYFCIAAMLASYVPRYVPRSVEWFSVLSRLGRAALTVVLFLIGTGITRSTLKEVGVRPLVQGVTLWVAVAGLSLWVIHVGWIAL